MTTWDVRHIEDQRARQIENSVALSTYAQRYESPRLKFSRLQSQLMALCLCAGSLYLLLYFGLLDWLADLF